MALVSAAASSARLGMMIPLVRFQKITSPTIVTIQVPTANHQFWLPRRETFASRRRPEVYSPQPPRAGILPRTASRDHCESGMDQANPRISVLQPTSLTEWSAPIVDFAGFDN